ncbi:MAG: GNAT family N-acetyltransferase [Maribacter sp.]|nr:GNAT family N-acetyltransferase [Maribacter sp.]MBT8315828.1 GNAT family N-acetyltransferase [Maribacter sp.]
MQLDYKECFEDDLELLVQISKTTFSDAFRADNDPDDFKAYLNAAFSKSKLTEELVNPCTSFYFVFDDNNLVGYFKLNINEAQSDLKRDDSIELERIYVIQEFQGQGIGKRILDYAKRLAAKTTKTFLWLGVWEKNKAAIKFYEQNGFSKFGMHPYYVGKDKQMDWLMRFDLINFNDH